MVTPQSHLAQAARNEEFANSISGLAMRFTEWEITALFYAALHYVSALFATQGHDPKDHRQRRNLVIRLTNVSKEYENLYQASLEARYDLVEFTPLQVELLKSNDFLQVKEEVLAMLGRGPS